MTSPLKITVYSSKFRRLGFIGDAVSVSMTLLFNGAGSVSIKLAQDSPKAPLLLTRGARLTVDYLGVQVFSGPVRSRSFEDGWVFQALDDFRLLQRVKVWPVPAEPIENQYKAEFRKFTDVAAETVLKTVIRENAVTRLGEPVMVAPDQGRGSKISAAFRFDSIYDRAFPAVETAGLGVTVKQAGARLVADVFTPKVRARPLTVASGIVGADYTWTQSEAEATDVLVGGSGEGTSRLFKRFTDPALADALGERSEVVVDARDADSGGDIYAGRASDAFVETGQKASISASLSETKNFRVHPTDGVWLGDRLTLQLNPYLTVTDTVRSLDFQLTREAGLVITPKVGERSDDPDVQVNAALNKLAAGMRNIARR